MVCVGIVGAAPHKGAGLNCANGCIVQGDGNGGKRGFGYQAALTKFSPTLKE